MDRFIMYPVAFITTVQPWIAAWVLAISFFLTMVVVALVARERTIKQLAMITAVTYIATVIVVGFGTALLSGFQMVEIEVVSISPSRPMD